MSDLAIIGQDPRFGGGARALMLAFWEAAVSLGRRPELLYLEHPSLGDRELHAPLDATGVRPPFGRLDALNQVWGGRRLAARIDPRTTAWVVATAASYGAAATRTTAFSCFVATALEDEWRPQWKALPLSRRIARLVNGPGLRAIERRVLANARSVFTISPAAREAVAAAGGLATADIGVIPLPVDVERFVPEPASAYAARLEAPVVIFVGRADDPRKNVRLLLDAWPTVLARHPRARLRLVGRPPAVGLPPAVDAAGEPADVAPELRRASLLVLPSTQEGFGIVAAEALAAGVPVVTTPSGGPEELVRASAGGVVLDGFEPGRLGSTVAELLDDEARLLRLRASGRTYVEREHSPDATRRAVAIALAEGGTGVR